MENQSYIYTENLSKTYKVGKQKVEALKKVSMKIGKGQMTAGIHSTRPASSPQVTAL